MIPKGFIIRKFVTDGDASDLPCDSKSLVGDFWSAVRDRELVFAEECVALPSKDGVITETAQDCVTEWQKKHLQHKQYAMSTAEGVTHLVFLSL